MSIEQVQGKNEAEVLVREGNLVKSNKGFKVEVYSVNGFEYFDKEGMRYKIKGYSGKNKVIFEGAGVVQKVQKEPEVFTPEVTTPVDTNGTGSSDKEAKAEYRKSLLARAELLGLEFSKNTPTASLETLVVSAEKAKAEAEANKAE